MVVLGNHILPRPAKKKKQCELPTRLDEEKERLPERMQRIVFALWEEVRALEERLEAVDAELESVARDEPIIQALRQIPGVGVLTATAFFAAVGNIHTFRSGRHLASWLGLTPRESSSGGRRRLGRISKQGDPYLRMLLIQGARPALITAGQRQRAGRSLNRLQQWALTKAREQHFNAAAVALARSPVHASRAASQDGTYPLGCVEARAPLRRQLRALGHAAGCLNRKQPVHPRRTTGGIPPRKRDKRDVAEHGRAERSAAGTKPTTFVTSQGQVILPAPGVRIP